MSGTIGRDGSTLSARRGGGNVAGRPGGEHALPAAGRDAGKAKVLLPSAGGERGSWCVPPPRILAKGSNSMTKVLLTRLLAGLLAALVLAVPARAEERKGSQPYVVLVGISQYPDKQIK